MKKFLAVVVALFVSAVCFGQQLPKGLNNDTSAYTYSPLMVIHVLNKPVKQYASMDILKQINPKDINAINIFKNSDSTKLYGPAAHYGILSIYTNDQVKLLDTVLYSFKDIQQVYKLQNATLPVYIDSDLVIHPERILLMPKTITMAKVYINKESGKEYINITTTDAEIKTSAKREHWIR